MRYQPVQKQRQLCQLFRLLRLHLPDRLRRPGLLHNRHRPVPVQRMLSARHFPLRPYPQRLRLHLPVQALLRRSQLRHPHPALSLQSLPQQRHMHVSAQPLPVPVPALLHRHQLRDKTRLLPRQPALRRLRHLCQCQHLRRLPVHLLPGLLRRPMRHCPQHMLVQPLPEWSHLHS